MINFSDFFHTNYTSSGNGERYIKISVLMNGIGMFCVIMNKRTSGVQCQKYSISKGHTPNERHYVGIDANGYCKSLDHLKNRWNSITNEERRMLMNCASVLEKSYRQYCFSNSMERAEQDEVREHIRFLRMEIHNLMNGISTPQTTPQTPTVSENWVRIEFNAMSQTELAEIISKINENNNPELGIEHKGRKYKIVRGERGMELRILEVSTETPIQRPQTDVEEVTQRKTSKKAQMRDNTNLTEFVNGCYYKIIKFLDNQFITIANDNGEERTVNKGRVTIVDVYDEAPSNA